MLRVLIADDHAVVRQGLKDILKEIPELGTTGEAVNGQDALEKLRASDWDLLLLDVSMPGLSGLEVLREVKHERPTLPVLVLSMHPEDQFAVRLLKAGAAGYLTKETAPDELIQAVRKIMSGGKYVSLELAEKLAEELSNTSERLAHEALSDREFQVMRMLASGKTVKEIAQDLALSVKTISTYRARILEKMSLKSNAELIHYAIQNKLID
jgi:DNA-binding NarL/FixJ family response regulator